MSEVDSHESVGTYERSPETDEGFRLRRGARALSGLERSGMLGDSPEEEKVKETIAVHAHTEWQNNVLPHLDTGLAQLGNSITAVRPLIDAGKFEITEMNALEDILTNLEADPRKSDGSLPHVFALTDEVLKDRARIDAMLGNPAFSTVPERKAALDAVRRLCNERLSIFQIDKPSLAFAEDRVRDALTVDGMDKGFHAARILIVAVAGMMAIACLYMKKSKGLLPAAVWGMLAFFAAGGTKLFTETSSERQLKKIAFLGGKGYQQLSETYGIKGKSGVEIAQALYDNDDVLKEYLKKVRNSTVTPEDQETLLADLGLSDAAEPTMRKLLQNSQDFRALHTYLTSAKDDESRANILACIAAAPSPEALRIYSRETTEALETSAATK